MKVLIACEYSGAVRDAFIALGHDAMTDARALQCGYPKRTVPYQGEELKLYEQFCAQAAAAYGVKR